MSIALDVHETVSDRSRICWVRKFASGLNEFRDVDVQTMARAVPTNRFDTTCSDAPHPSLVDNVGDTLFSPPNDNYISRLVLNRKALLPYADAALPTKLCSLCNEDSTLLHAVVP
jgi:hypothetical protein